MTRPARNDEQRAPIKLIPRAARAHQGSEAITTWCAKCQERVVPMRNGTCGWCGAPVDVPTPVGQAADAPTETASELAPDEIPPRRDRRHLHGEPYTDEIIFDRVERWERIFGAPPMKTDWDAPKLRKMLERAVAKVQELTERIRRYEEGDWPGESTIRERFGSMNALREQCGYPAIPTGRPARSVMPNTRPPAGEVALRGYFRDVAQARESGDRLALKAALYTLALSAIREADRIEGAA